MPTSLLNPHCSFYSLKSMIMFNNNDCSFERAFKTKKKFRNELLKIHFILLRRDIKIARWTVVALDL